MSEITRRTAIKLLGAAPLAGLFAPTASQIERAADRVRDLADELNSLSAPSGRFFTVDEYRNVRLLADYIIPRDERSGSATDARVPEFIDALMADADTSPAARTAMRGGLAWLEGECRRRHNLGFMQASDAQRRHILDDIAWPAKARGAMTSGVAFFTQFRDLVATGFFSSAMGYEDLRYRGNVFYPEWNGCPDAALEKLGVSYDLMRRRVPS
ncbi:MAG: gluconate 2-dehydrogenase subunit 3 family protein [Gemmatimonadaceae bacterium]